MLKPRFSIRPGKNKDLEGKLFSIYYDLNFKTGPGKYQRLRGSTNTKVQFEYWDDKNRTILDGPDDVYLEKASAKKKELKAFTRHINKNILPELEGQSDYKTKLEGKINIYLKKTEDLEEKKEKGLFEFLDELIDEFKESDQPSTVQEFSRFRFILKLYNKQKRLSLTYDSINQKLYNDFKKYLKGPIKYKDEKGIQVTAGNCANNTINNKYLKPLKRLLSESFADGQHDNRFFMKKKKFIIVKEDTFATFINEEELKLLEQTKLDLDSKERAAVDYWLIMALTSLRIGDTMRLNNSSIKNIEVETKKGKKKVVPMIVYKEHKSKRKGKEPRTRTFLITDQIQAILDHYNGFPNDQREAEGKTKINRDDINLIIKHACRKAGINEITTFKNTKQQTVSEPKYKLITGHTGRRSWCTNRRLEGWSIARIKEQSGHSKDAELNNYIKAKNPDVIAKLEYLRQKGIIND